MDKILFRCSALGKLMTEPKLKSDKEAGNISETAKTFVEEMWLENTFGYKERVLTDEMSKGIECEESSFDLIQQVLKGEFRAKNLKRYSNEYIIGEPDLITSDYVEDAKTSWNLRTFFNAEITKDYEAQLQGYMWLLGKQKARLIYCLVKTPNDYILNEQKKLYYRFNCDESNPMYKSMCDQLEHNNNLIDAIPAEKRIKVFEIEQNQDFIDKLKNQVEKARNYYNTLTL